jgi:hypothetical protein
LFHQLFVWCLLACFWGFCIYNNNYCFVPSRASKQASKRLIKISKQFEFKACKLCNMLTYIVYCGTGEWVPITQLPNSSRRQLLREH